MFWALFMSLLFLSGSWLSGLFSHKGVAFNLSYGIAGTISVILATWIFLKIEKRSFRDIGLIWERKTIYRFFKGILIGTIIFSGIILILLAFTALQWQKGIYGLRTKDVAAYLTIIPLALMEELAFRAYPFLKLNKVLGLRITQVVVAIVFALYHIICGWDVSIAFLGPGVWALVFGLAAIWSGGIAVPTGIHVALNVWQSMVGMKDNFGSVWILKYNGPATDATIAKTEMVGLMTQLLVFVCAVILTEYYIRKKQKNRLTKKAL